MKIKVTWNVVRSDFKRHHPKLHKDVIYWRPYDYATILLHLADGRKCTYNYDTKKTNLLERV